MIIERDEAKKINSTKAWTLVYGRRKTGKTFLVQNFVKYDYYFFVRQDKAIIHKDQNLAYEAFLQLFLTLVKENKIIVVDEFHRLPKEFFDYLHYISPERKGRLILISSTLCLAKNFFSPQSPLLGLFAEVPVPIIGFSRVLKALDKIIPGKKERLEAAVLLREPSVIPLFNQKSHSIGDIILFTRKAVPALIGEIFSEEQRTLSSIYEGILRAVANGKVTSGEISSSLFSKKLMPKNDPSYVQQYLSNLIEFGLIRKIAVFGKNRQIYKHTSPLIRLYYFADEKYNFGEKEPALPEVDRIIQENLPHIIEDNIREAFALKFGLTETIAEGRDFEVDGLFLKFKKPEIALEVKWKKKLKREDLEKAVKNLNKFSVKRKILFVPDKQMLNPFKRELKSIEIMDVKDLER